jgi:hypothetical protein
MRPLPRVSPLAVVAVLALASASAFTAGCSASSEPEHAATSLTAHDPSTAAVASVDRFSDAFAHLFKRSAPAFDPADVSKVVPAPNAPIDFDALFLVHALGPDGGHITYYSFDIAPATAGHAYRLMTANGQPVAGQLPVLTALPGDAGYNDFVAITEVTVGAGYVANSAVSDADVEALVASGAATMHDTQKLANWVVVPKGSTANGKYLGTTPGGHTAWIRGQVASYLEFETALPGGASGAIPAIPIYVIFKNGADPSQGFATEPGTMQTHNVVAELPGNPGYSSLWDHYTAKLSAFAAVKDLASAQANEDMKIPVLVNCPVVD